MYNTYNYIFIQHLRTAAFCDLLTIICVYEKYHTLQALRLLCGCILGKFDLTAVETRPVKLKTHICILTLRMNPIKEQF